MGEFLEGTTHFFPRVHVHSIVSCSATALNQDRDRQQRAIWVSLTEGGQCYLMSAIYTHSNAKKSFVRVTIVKQYYVLHNT